MSTEWDAAVVGGGPAGSAAAIELARAGRTVCLLERKGPTHHKVCGEFISWEASHYLQQLGVDLKAAGALPIERLRLVAGGEVLDSALPFSAWSLSRRRMDALLLQEAENAGALVQYHTTVKSLERKAAQWHLDCSDGPMKSRCVFLASGKRDLRKWRRVARSDTEPVIGLKMHLRLSALQHRQLLQTVELHLLPGGYAGLEAVEDSTANLCFLIPKSVHQQCCGDWSRILDWLAAHSELLGERLTRARSLWERPLAVSGTPYGYICDGLESEEGMFRLGDQMAVIPSLAGDGIAIALHSAKLATAIHLAGKDSGEYYRRAQEAFVRPVRRAEALSRLLSSRGGRRFAFLLGRLHPPLVAHTASGIRLGEHAVGTQQ